MWKEACIIKVKTHYHINLKQRVLASSVEISPSRLIKIYCCDKKFHSCELAVNNSWHTCECWFDMGQGPKPYNISFLPSRITTHNRGANWNFPSDTAIYNYWLRLFQSKCLWEVYTMLDIEKKTTFESTGTPMADYTNNFFIFLTAKQTRWCR